MGKADFITDGKQAVDIVSRHNRLSSLFYSSSSPIDHTLHTISRSRALTKLKL